MMGTAEDFLPRFHRPRTTRCHLGNYNGRLVGFGLRFSWQGHYRHNGSAPAGRANIQLATQLPDPRSHSCDAYAELGRIDDLIQKFVDDSASLVAHLQSNSVLFLCQLDSRRLAAGMPVNVAETLLHDAEERCLYVERETLQVGRQVKIHEDAAALGEALG